MKHYKLTRQGISIIIFFGRIFLVSLGVVLIAPIGALYILTLMVISLTIDTANYIKGEEI